MVNAATITPRKLPAQIRQVASDLPAFLIETRNRKIALLTLRPVEFEFGANDAANFVCAK